MNKYKEKWIFEKKRESVAAMRIHRFIRKCSYDPTFKFARSRLAKEYISECESE